MQHHKLPIEPPADMEDWLRKLEAIDKKEARKIRQQIKQHDKEIKKL